METHAHPNTILIIDPAADETLHLACQPFAVAHARDPREAIQQLTAHVALLLCRWDPACVEPHALRLAIHAARATNPRLMAVTYLPAGIRLPPWLLAEIDLALWAHNVPGMLGSLVDIQASFIRPVGRLSLPLPGDSDEPDPAPPIETRDAVRRRVVRAALAATDGDKTAAAHQLGIKRQAFYRKRR